MQQQMQHPSLGSPYLYGPSFLPTPHLPINLSVPVPAPPGFDKPPPYPANFFPGGMLPMQPPQPVIPPSLPSSFAPAFTPASTMQPPGPPPLATVQPLQHIPPLATVAPSNNVSPSKGNSNKENVPQPPEVSSANDEVAVDANKFEKRVLMKK